MCDVTAPAVVRIVLRYRGSRYSYAIEGVLHVGVCGGPWALAQGTSDRAGVSVDTLEILCDIQSHNNWSGGACGRISAKARITTKTTAVTQSHRQKLEFYPIMLGRVHLILAVFGTNASSRLRAPRR